MEKEQFWCRNCKISIGGHNKYLHDGMCDNCFFDVYFPEEAQIVETDSEKMRVHCRSNPVKKENLNFKAFLRSKEIDQERIGKIVNEIKSQITCPHGGKCCNILKPMLKSEDLDTFLVNAEFCPIIFNVLENAKNEFLEEIYEFENPDV